MICFRDKTYCPFWESCKDGIGCDRALTEKVQVSAEKWWGSNDFPISLFTDEPECYQEINIVVE